MGPPVLSISSPHRPHESQRYSESGSIPNPDNGRRVLGGMVSSPQPKADWQVDDRLRQMFTKEDGNINLNPGVYFDEQNAGWPFLTVRAAVPISTLPVAAKPSQKTINKSPETPPGEPAIKLPSSQSLNSKKQSPRYKSKTDAEIIADLFLDDIADEAPASKKQITLTVLQRNQKIVAALKALYGGRCQLTGDQFVFKKTDGELYCEAHHLLALGSGGADSPYNLVT